MTKNKTPSTPFQLPTESIVPTVPMPQQQGMSVEQALALASQHQQEGRLQEAESLLNQVLQLQPENAQALHTLGIVAHMAGKTPIGIELIERAIQSDNKVALFHANVAEMYRLMKNLGVSIAHGRKAVRLDKNMVTAHANLGIAYYDNKEFDKAEISQKKALALNPDFVPSLNNIGSIFRERKDKEKAVEYYTKALKADPNYIESMNNIAATLVQLDKPEVAMLHLDKALMLNPNYADAHCNKGFALQALDQDEQAFSSFQTALHLRPEYVEAFIGVARMHHDKHELDLAEDIIKKALKINADMPEALSVLGAVYMSQGHADQAEEEFNKALKLDKDLTSANLGVGNIYVERGNFDAAEKLFLTVLSKGEDKASALFSLAQVRKVKEGDEILQQMQDEVKSLDGLPEGKAIHIHFAMGKIYDDLKEPKKAFPHFIEGCRLKRKKLNYSIEEKQKAFATIKEIFTKDFIEEHRGHGNPSDLPVFVLGMPRSGTTLTEQIIASHPDVFGAGELTDLMDITKGNDEVGSFPNNMCDLTPERINEIGMQYVEGLQKRSPESKKITDKMPANFYHVGLIHLALPNAKIVHLQRHPLDTCISCFTRLFAHNQDNTYNLEELGHFYREYKDLMAHWRNVLPKGAFYDIRYEDIVNDTKSEAKALIDYCGLEWNDSCLEFYKNKRNIRTASVTQVRQPIYKSSVARWKRYEEFLSPLINSLGNALDGEKM